MNKKSLSERDICTKFITPAVKQAGWDELAQIREEVGFTKGRIIVRGKLVTRGKAKRADYVLYYKPNIPIAIIEAKDNNHSVGGGMQQVLEHAAALRLVGRIANSEYQKLVGVIRRTAARDLDDLVADGVLLCIGEKRGGHYVLARRK
jgi:type I site-specific restriction endonuclease